MTDLDDEERQSDHRHRPGRRNARRAQDEATEAPEEQYEDARDRCAVDEREPPCSTVGAGHEAVQRGERPDREVEVVRGAPEPVWQTSPVVVRDREREQQLGRGDAEPRPERTVGGRERDEQLSQ